jgi:MarR family transcriptional regulator, organic hydroperoxide resistance regulator
VDYAGKKVHFSTYSRFFIFRGSSAFTLAGKKVIMESVKMRSKATGNLYANSLYFVSSVLARQIEKLATEVWKPSGLPPSQGYMLLHILYHSDYSFPCFISRRLLLSRSAVTQLVDKLEKKGLVVRFTGEHCTVIRGTEMAWNLEPTLAKCERDFRDRCDALLGADTGALTALMNRATDKLYEATEKR